MEEKKQQNVTIKGTKDGITLHLDDCCSFSELLKELDEKLSTHYYDGDGRSLIEVHVKVGNRYLTEVQQEEIRTLIRNKKNLVVDSIESDVITKEEAIAWKEETEIVPISKIVRSGQVLHVKGNLLLIGDVNPGGTVIAGGNIFVVGSLRGIAHAGYYGDSDAVIVVICYEPDATSELVMWQCGLRKRKKTERRRQNVRILMRTITLLSIDCNFSLILDLI